MRKNAKPQETPAAAVTAASAEEKPSGRKTLTIQPPKQQVAEFLIEGTAPYVQHAFPARIGKEIERKQAEGTQRARRIRDLPPKDFALAYRECFHIDVTGGWYGQPATAWRKCLVAACGLAGFNKRIAQNILFVEADGRDAEGVPLVRILEGEPVPHRMSSRNPKTGAMMPLTRPMWKTWRVLLRIRFNAKSFTELDIANLLLHAGIGIGVGEGRPDSPKSVGMDWGTFTLAETAEQAEAAS